jgi:hypothetical protein
MKKKKVHITFDYELFFGESSGTVNKCMIEPSQKLAEIASQLNVKFVFFVDAGCLWALRKFQDQKNCREDYQKITEQLKELHSKGHEIALHVHPHWEDCVYKDDGWQMNVSRYRLADFSEPQIAEIVTRYHDELKLITGEPCRSFRAGGWCIQPFTKIRGALLKNQIFTDSSVFKNGHHEFTAQSYDFMAAPDKDQWRFSVDECKEDEPGEFLELPIAPDTISPAFYFSLYFKMRLNPVYYRPLGDGSWLKDKKKIYRQFYSFTNHFACCDGYFASRLKKNLLRNEKKGKRRFVVLGHPKSLAPCSYDYLSEFIKFAGAKGYNVTTFYESART